MTGKEPLGKKANDEVRWVFPPRDPTEAEKINLWAAALEIGIKRSFSTHTYQFGGKLFQQAEGGPIGMRLTGACARIVMGVWSRTVNEILKKENIENHLAAGYVDDVRYVTSTIGEGWRWQEKEKKLVFDENWQEEDHQSAETVEARTSREILNIMNSVFTNIQFTKEIPEDFKSGRLPTLDFAMWLEGKGKIKYSFYEKEVNSKFCVMEKAAMAEMSKISTLAQDLIRRMVNTSDMIEQAERNEIIEKYIVKLRTSGYSTTQVQNIVVSGLKGYQTKLKNAIKNGTQLHREAKQTLGARHRKKLTAKTSWYKQPGKNKSGGGARKLPGPKAGKGKMPAANNKLKNKSPVTVLFVPRTPGGKLATLIKQAEQEISEITGNKIKIVEKAGKMLKRIIHKSNPWAAEDCYRDECLVCTNGGDENNGDCRVRNILYQTTCLPCKATGTEAVYWGESSRTAYERGKEHLGDFKSQSEKSHMYRHQLEDHSENDGMVRFSMKVHKTFQSAFNRQIYEAVMIMRNEGKKLLNSKEEYNRCILPRLTVMMGKKEAEGADDKVNHEISEIEEENLINRARERKRKDSIRGNDIAGSQPKEKKRRRWKIEDQFKRKSQEKEARKSKKIRLEMGPSILTATTRKNQLEVEGKIVNATPESPIEMKISSEKEKICRQQNTTVQTAENFNDILTMFRKISEKKEKQDKITKNSENVQKRSIPFLKASKFTPSMLNLQVAQTGEEKPTSVKSDNKANSNLSRGDHHTSMKIRGGLKERKKRSTGPSLPPNFNYKPIQQYFNPPNLPTPPPPPDEANYPRTSPNMKR